MFKISEEEYLNQNIKKIKQYFEDYLAQVKEAEEYEKLKRKMEEEARIQEMKEKQKRQRFVLPRISSCEISDVTENSAVIKVPIYDENEIINKNKYIIIDCIEKYGKTKIEYVVYFYDNEKNIYEKKIFQKLKENIEGNKYKIKLTNLKENQIYLILLGIKFAENYSNPTSNKFYFITSPKVKHGNIFIYGDFNCKNNFVDVDEREEIIKLPKNVKSYKECLKDEKTLFPLLYGDIIQDISVSDRRTCCVTFCINFICSIRNSFSFFKEIFSFINLTLSSLKCVTSSSNLQLSFSLIFFILKALSLFCILFLAFR